MYIEKITQIINEWDPIDLLKTGCPNDEYQPEVNEIFNNMSNNIDHLANTIYNVFIKMFGKDIFNKDINECILIANKILS